MHAHTHHTHAHTDTHYKIQQQNSKFALWEIVSLLLPTGCQDLPGFFKNSPRTRGWSPCKKWQLSIIILKNITTKSNRKLMILLERTFFYFKKTGYLVQTKPTRIRESGFNNGIWSYNIWNILFFIFFKSIDLISQWEHCDISAACWDTVIYFLKNNTARGSFYTQPQFGQGISKFTASPPPHPAFKWPLAVEWNSAQVQHPSHASKLQSADFGNGWNRK